VKTQRQQLGKVGEEIAQKYLLKNGYALIAKNLRLRRGEIDIICAEKDELVIVEVKSVRTPGFGQGEERISRKKRLKIIRTTYNFLGQNPAYKFMDVRFDVIVVNFFKYPAQINHYKGAFWEQ